MSRLNRETEAVNSIDCPRCSARRGMPCVWTGPKPWMPMHGPPCCKERRSANQKRRRDAGLAGPDPRGPHA